MNKLAESRTRHFEEANADFRVCLFNRLVFLFLILMKCDAKKNNSKNKQCSKGNKEKIRSLHLFYSPLLKNIASPKIRKNTTNPQINKASLKPSFETMGPSTTIARIILAISKRFFEMSSFCCLLNFIIGSILSKAKVLVKQVVQMDVGAPFFEVMR